MSKTIIVLFILLNFLLPNLSHAFVSSNSGGQTGDFVVDTHSEIQRGVIKPHTDKVSHQKAHLDIFGAGLTYNWGTRGWMKDLYSRIGYTWFQTKEERVGSKVFYGPDSGTYAELSLGWNVVRKTKQAFGFFLKFAHPFGVDLNKFSSLQMDSAGVGMKADFWFHHGIGYLSQFYIGSGIKKGGARQNSRVALTNYLAFQKSTWLLPYFFLFKLGPHFDGDLSERFDSKYDKRFSKPDVPDPIRQFRFGIIFQAYFGISEKVGADIGYVQKLFGLDSRASKDAFFNFSFVL